MKKVLLFLLIILLMYVVVKADNISFTGYYKSFFTCFLLPEYKSSNPLLDLEEPPIGAVNNRVRLKLFYNITDKISVNASYDFSPRVQDKSFFEEDIYFAEFEPLNYRFEDLPQRIYPKEGKDMANFGIFHNLDRLFFTLNTEVADIYLGRQAISWGSAHVINPTDVIAPYAFNELDVEERKGVDAIRIRIPLGMMDEFDLGYVVGENFKFSKSAFFLRGKFYIFRTDLSFLFMGFREHLMLGVDMTRAIGGAGSWIEAAYVVPYFFEKKKDYNEDNYFRISAGMDYNFSGNLYGFFEYHFNSAGENKPGGYMNEFQKSPFVDGTVYLMGKHYFNVGLNYQITPLIPFTGLIIFNISDNSVTLSPNLEYNIAENIYLTSGAYIGIGKKPELCLHPFSEMTSSIILNSEFGAYPDIIFTSFKIYF